MPTPEDRKILPRIIFPVGVLLTLALAYLLDSWLFTQTRLSRATDFTGIRDPLFLWTVVSGLVLFVAWLALSWITLTRGHRSTLFSIIVLIVGLLLYVYPFLQLVVIWIPMIFFTVRTPLAYTGLFVAVLSILHLLVTNPNKLGS